MSAASGPLLFEPWQVRGVRLRNRIGVSPMCQYEAPEGLPTDWHLVHLGSRAVGGAGLVVMESTAVAPEGRITPYCLNLSADDRVEPFAHLAGFIREQGAVAGIQLSHAGRKASQGHPARGGGLLTEATGGWEVVGASTIAFDDGWQIPRELSSERIQGIVAEFASAARRAVDAGFEYVEIHAAHGYLLHSFLSPLSNRRDDDYGGDFDRRSRIVRDVARAVRAALGEELVLAVRLSCTDWVADGWQLSDSVRLARLLRDDGVDIIDCSSGGAAPAVKIPVGPRYQEPFAAQIRAGAGIATAAVGMYQNPRDAEDALVAGACDMVLIGRESLRDPYWPHHARALLGADIRDDAPVPYSLAWKSPRSSDRVPPMASAKDH